MTCSTSEVAVCCSSLEIVVRAQLVEQPRVLDGDDGLGGEVAHQLDLLVGEWTHLLAKNADRADKFVVLEHRDAHDRPIVAEFNRSEPVRIVNMRRNVVDLDHLLRGGSSPEGGVRRRPETQLASACLGIGGRRVVQRDGAKRISFAKPKRAEFGLTNASGIRKHRLEHWLQLTRRATDDTQHLRGRGLLLQRLGEIARARLHLVEQPHVLDRDHRLVGEGGDQLDLLVGERPDLGALQDA